MAEVKINTDKSRMTIDTMEICGQCGGTTNYMNGEEGYPPEDSDEVRQCEWCGFEFYPGEGNWNGQYINMTMDYGDFNVGDMVRLIIRDEPELEKMGCPNPNYVDDWPDHWPVSENMVPDDVDIHGLITKKVPAEDGWMGFYYFVVFTSAVKYGLPAQPVPMSGWNLELISSG